MDGKEGRGDGRKVKGTPKEERDAAHREVKLGLISLGRQGGGGCRQPGQAGGRKGKWAYHG